MENQRSEWVTRLYKISAGLIGGYFLICCLAILFPQVPLKLVMDVHSDTINDAFTLPVRAVLFAGYLHVVPYAVFSLLRIYPKAANEKTLLFIAGIYYGIINIAGVPIGILETHLLLSMVDDVKAYGVLQSVNTCIALLSPLYGTGVVLMFCALAIEVYENSKRTADIPSE